MNRVIYWMLLLSLPLFASACAVEKRPYTDISETGSVIVRAEWPVDMRSDIATVRMIISGSDMRAMSQDFRFTDISDIIHGVHGVPAGDNRTINLEGLDSDNVKRYEGITNASVVPGQVIDGGLIVMEPVLVIPSATSASPAPTNVRAEAGDGQVTIRWDMASGAENYGVYMNRKPGASRKNFDARKSTATNSYTWTGLRNGTTYYFAVTAENKSGESNDSDEVSSTPDVAPIAPAATRGPAVPTNVRAEAGDGQVTIRWDLIPGADGYGIYMNKAPGASKKNFDARKSATSNSYTWTGLNNRTTYYIVVTAENRYGESNNSQELNIRPGTPAAVPKVPEPVAPVAVPEVPVKTADAKLSPQEILLKVDEIRAPGNRFVQDTKITFKKGDKETVNKMSVRVKDFHKSLAIYTQPASEKGRVILMVENNMWIYFPGSKKAIRISPAQKLLGQVSNADVSRVVYSTDYKAESVEEDNTAGKNLLKMSLKAKTSGAAYGSILLWIKKDSYKPFKAEFFTLSGRLLKTIYYKGYKRVLGKERPTIYEIHDAINKEEISIMEYTSMKIEDTPDKYFQKTFMNRASRLNP